MSKRTKKAIWLELADWLLTDEADTLAAEDDILADVQSAYGSRWRQDRISRAELLWCVAKMQELAAKRVASLGEVTA